jgi:hypothetical protein
MASNRTVDLTLPQAFTLLLLDPEGNREVNGTTLGLGIAGAILADLALRGGIDLQNGRVAVASNPPAIEDDLLSRSLGWIAANGRPRPAKWWVSKLAGPDTREAVALSLVQNGLLDERHGKVLGLFPKTSYPEIDGAPEEELRAQLAAVLADDEDPTPPLAALVALLDATGTLHKQFGRVPRNTVQAISSGSTWAAPAVKAVLDHIRNSAVAAVAAASASSATAAAASATAGS